MVTVSIFSINIKDIRNLYTGKYQQIIEKEVKLIASRAKASCYDISTKFAEITDRIRREPTTIEELTETRKYISEIGATIEKLKLEIDDCMRTYEIAGEFHHEFSAAENDDKWHLYGAPRRVMECIEAQSVVLEKAKEAFIKAMEQEQEEFEEHLDSLEMTVAGFAAYDDLKKYADYAENVASVNERLLECVEKSRLFAQREFLVGKDQKDYGRLATMQKDFAPYSNLWLTTKTWYERHEAWTTGAWEDLDPAELDTTFEACAKAINQVCRYFRDRNFPKITANAQAMKAKVEEFKSVVPVALALRKEGMQERHWDQLSEKVGFDVRPCEGFTLTTIVEKGLLAHAETADEVGEKAFKEHHIEQSLKKMQAAWEGQDFRLPQFKATTTSYISGFEDAVAMLDEHIVTAQAMQFSPFKKPFEAEIETWATTLMLVSDTLEEWVKCQGAWMYLQPIFDSPDIMKQLPQETKRFKSVDSTWRQQINVAKGDPSILRSCGKEGLKEKFQEANKNLEIVQKGLADYLEKKRSVFARFYFLSNDELLEILSQTKEVRNVRPHLRKVFEAIADLVFEDDDTMWAMISAEGERVNFVKRVDPTGRNVEYWMGDVEKMMTTSVRDVLLKAIEDYTERPRTQWVKCHAGMCVLNGSQVHWTSDVEKAIMEKGCLGAKEYHEFLEKQLADSVLLVREKLSKQAKLTLNALIVIDVHAKDVVGTLVANEVDDIGAFEWISQLRYYWEEDDCYVKCVQTNFPYGYEYLGNSMRLVITPLTDKCYMTLMGALALNLGGAPAGPAGTGKTESTKDLAKALAKQCVVFNCSDGMDHLMIAKFFKGLASAGAWCCFDEFNRINIEVLSVIAQQLLVLFGAKARGDPEIEFEGSNIKVKPTFCVFITMNPGYAGRTELPDNLKAFFRPVAMMVPDYALIGEIMLYSFGFLEGRGLARKMVTTFTLSSEQLSSQDHYDYGMRAVRSVINAAGLLKADYPDTNEQQLLLRALRDVNVPKFLKDDIPLFENIILDLFPGLERPAVDYGDLGEAITASCAHYNVQEVPLFIEKILQLYDTI
jgi:dynein heavy chain